MKAKITITPKQAVLDPQGEAVRGALGHMGFDHMGEVRVGRYVEIQVDGDDAETRAQVDKACHQLLSNPVIEDYHFEISD